MWLLVSVSHSFYYREMSSERQFGLLSYGNGFYKNRLSASEYSFIGVKFALGEVISILYVQEHKISEVIGEPEKQISDMKVLIFVEVVALFFALSFETVFTCSKRQGK